MSKTDRSLRTEAEEILQNLDLLELLNRYGEAQVVGSVALDLVVKRDIDVHLVVRSSDLLGTVDEIYHQLLEKEHIREVRISDYRDRASMKIGIDTYPGASGHWSIDIWMTHRVETTGFALVDRLKRALRPEHREAILRIKTEYHRRGRLRDGFSASIYEAVVDKGVQSVEDFHRFLLESGYESSL